MKILRFKIGNSFHFGLMEAEVIKELKDFPFPYPEETGRYYPREEVEIQAPLSPSKIIAVGLNYSDHARELGIPLPPQPVIFLKPPSAIIGPEEPIIYPRGVGRLDPEAELAVVIGRQARSLAPEKADSYIWGYTCLNDVTARDLQSRDKQWTRSKSYDTFCPLGPWIETELDPGRLAIRLKVNGLLRQDSNTSNLISPVPELVSFVSQIMTLLPGDIIATGTPAGIAPVQIGDRIEVEIEGIGSLFNPVAGANSPGFHQG